MALLGNLKGSAHVFPETEYYNNVGMTSVRFEDGSSTYLTKTFSSDGTGSGATCTISCWVKRASISNNDQWFFTAGSSSPAWLFGFRTADTLAFGDDDGNPFVTVTDRKFRDTSAWYHLVLAVKTSESSNADKYKIYVNGELQTSTFSGTAADTLFGANVVHNIGRYPTGSTYVDLYMSDLNFVDGLALDPTYFGESKNGVWIPKEPVVSEYGTNGFRFKFDQTGVGSGASNTIGADSSGKDNHFTSSGIAAHDCAMPDSPENVFCTMNPLVNTNGADQSAFSEGNLKITKSGTTYSFFQSTFGVRTGKWYAEIRCNAKTDVHFMIGVTEMNIETYMTGDAVDPHLTAGTVWYSDNGYGHYDGSGVSTSTFSNDTGFNAGQVVGIALDLDSGTRTVKFYVDGSLVTTQNLPSSMVDHIGFACNWYDAHTGVWNFGQDSTFAGEETAGGNSDGNGIGDFHTSVPSGYLALCTANFDEPTIGPDSATQADDHFNTVLYTGDGSGQSITGVGFQPDWTWIKSRSHASSHVLTDSSRGVTKSLFSDTTGDEQTLSGGVTAFGTDGFTLGSEGTVNTSSRTYVGWNWKANGATTTTNDASSTSVGTIDSVFQANTTAGFSIVLHTGTGSAGTVAHGLGVAPDWIITKGRTNTNHWTILHSSLGATKFIDLNQTNGSDTSTSVWNDTNPTSTVFSVGTNSRINGSSVTYVSYCFAEIESYSKFGSYTGNGSTDGAFIYLGFRPAFVIIKQTNQTNNWIINDSARDTFNVGQYWLYADGNFAEESGSSRYFDFVSNGIKLRNGGTGQNDSGDTYIYMAFAEQPFKFANAR